MAFVAHIEPKEAPAPPLTGRAARAERERIQAAERQAAAGRRREQHEAAVAALKARNDEQVAAVVPYQEFRQRLAAEMGRADGERRVALQRLDFDAALEAGRDFEALKGLDAIADSELKHVLIGKRLVGINDYEARMSGRLV